MKQVEARKLTDTVRDPSDQLSGRDDAASETQFPLFNLHWGGGRGRIAAIGEAARDVCLEEKTLIGVANLGSARLPVWNFGVAQK